MIQQQQQQRSVLLSYINHILRVLFDCYQLVLYRFIYFYILY